MQKTVSKWIAMILVLAAVFTMLPTALAAPAAALDCDKLSFTVGHGTIFKEIGLPETIYKDGAAIASVSWKQGDYDGEKAGTYTLSGTAKLTSGGTCPMTAYVTVKDCGFRLPVMTEYIATVLTTRKNRTHQYEGFRRLGCTPLFESGSIENYTWIYRWYVTSAPGVAGTLFSNDKDCILDLTTPNQYYYCKVTGTKDGVSTTLTSRYVYVHVQSNEELMSYTLTPSVDEIVPGEDFKLTATSGLTFINGAFNQFYYSGVDNYIPHFEFSSTTKGVSFSEDTVIGPRGVANVTVHTDASVAEADKIDISVHISTVGTSKIYYVDLVIDNTVSTSVKVAKPVAERTLTDVTNEWYADGVRDMLEKGYMSCKADTAFGASEYMTRGEMVTTLYRAAGFPDITDIQNDLDDVMAGQSYVNAVLWSTKNGIMTGTGKYTFSPEGYVTRQQFATILFRFAGSPTSRSSISSFRDAGQVSDYAQDAMKWAVSQKILTGNGGLLQPNGYCTRAMVATILSRYLGK